MLSLTKLSTLVSNAGASPPPAGHARSGGVGAFASSFVKQPLTQAPLGQSDAWTHARPRFGPASHDPPNLILHFATFAASGATPVLSALDSRPSRQDFFLMTHFIFPASHLLCACTAPPNASSTASSAAPNMTFLDIIRMTVLLGDVRLVCRVGVRGAMT